MNPILLLILFIVFCVITAILCFRLLHEEKNNKRREEKRIRELMEIPAYVNGEIEKRLNMLYDYFNAFPEKKQGCQELLLLIDKTWSEAERLEEDSGYYADIL